MGLLDLARRIQARAVLAAVLLALGAWGCGTDSTPVAPEEPALIQAADGRVFVTFSKTAALQVAKLAAIPPEGRAVSGIMGVNGTDKLKVVDYNQEGEEDDLKVTFSTPPDALAEDVPISMAVYGNTLSDIVVEFGPDGLVFLVDAELEIQLGRKLVDLELTQLVVWHIHDNGLTEIATHRLKDEEGSVKIQVDVPGFSKYSSGGGDDPGP